MRRVEVDFRTQRYNTIGINLEDVVMINIMFGLVGGGGKGYQKGERKKEP